MKVFRRFLLIALLLIGGATMVPVNSSAGLFDEVAGWVLGELGNVFGIGQKAVENRFKRQLVAGVESIDQNTNATNGKLEELNRETTLMKGTMGDLWTATNGFYEKLKVLNREIGKYGELLRAAKGVRDVYGYCGAANTLMGRSQNLTLDEMEYILGRSLYLQEYTLKRVERLMDVVNSDKVSMSDYERLQLILRIAEEQGYAVREARNLVARVKGFELRHQLNVADQQFQESFLNLRL